MEFPEPHFYDDAQLDSDIQSALVARPEIQFLDFMREQLEVDMAQARNLYLPEMNMGAVGSQDLGGATSATRDKSPFELEASLLVSVPLQRRKALGKIQAAQGKLTQVMTKQQFASDKITVDVRNAVVALQASWLRIEQARQSVDLNLTMENAERTRFELGDSNLLIVNLREQATADARKTLVHVQLEYFEARADYDASLATVPVTDQQVLSDLTGV